MAKNILIDYDAKLNKFVVTCPVWANDALAGIPSKSWSKARRGWAVPLLRRNVEYIEGQLINTGLAGITDAAKSAIDRARESMVRTMERGNGFPSWYPFKTTPRNHQMQAYQKMYGLHPMAFHADRGTGKSKMAIDIACCLRMEGKIDALLVVCKLSLRRNWVGYDHGEGPGQREGFVGHAPIECDMFLPDSGSDKKFDKWLSTPHDFKVLIIGTESLSQGRTIDMAMRFMSVFLNPGMVIDETHMISSHKAERSENCVTLGRKAAYRMSLTGTPISTGPMNLYMQFEYLDPNIIGIGDYYAFRNRYAVMGGYCDPRTHRPMQIVGYQNMEELTQLVAPYVFEVRKSDVLDLPPKVYERRYVTLTPEQRKLYDQIKKEGAYEWNGKEMVAQNVLELALRLHQVTGGFVTTHREESRRKKDGTEAVKKVSEWHEIIPPDRNPKVKEILDLAETDCQQIIWCPYRPEIDAVCGALRNAYPGELIREIHGGISEDDRETFKNEFQSGKAKWLVGNTATGGTGLTLTAAEIMVFYGNTQKMVDREQAEDRAHRDGLQHSVLYVDLIAEKSVDEMIISSIEDKVDLSEFIRKSIREASNKL